MPQVVSRAFLAPLRSLLGGCKNKAIPSTRWMRTWYKRISLGSPDTEAVTCPKPPRGSATSSPSSVNNVSLVHGSTRFPSRSIDQCLDAYDTHLEQVAGLAFSTRQNYRHIVRGFLTTSFGAEPPDWSALTAESL